MKGKKRNQWNNNKESRKKELAELYLNLSKTTLSNFDKNVEEAGKDLDDLDRQVDEALKLLSSQ